jgi:hypothetical protein
MQKNLNHQKGVKIQSSPQNQIKGNHKISIIKKNTHQEIWSNFSHQDPETTITPDKEHPQITDHQETNHATLTDHILQKYHQETHAITDQNQEIANIQEAANI